MTLITGQHDGATRKKKSGGQCHSNHIFSCFKLIMWPYRITSTPVMSLILVLIIFGI